MRGFDHWIINSFYPVPSGIFPTAAWVLLFGWFVILIPTTPGSSATEGVVLPLVILFAVVGLAGHY